MENEVIDTDDFAYAPCRRHRDTGSAASRPSISIKKKCSFRYVKLARNPRPEKSAMKIHWVDHLKKMMSKTDKQLSQTKCCEKEKCFQVVDKVALLVKIVSFFKHRTIRGVLYLQNHLWQFADIFLKTVMYEPASCILRSDLVET